VAALHVGRDDDEAAIDTLLSALKVCPHWPDAYFALARVYYGRQDWHKVIHWSEVGRAMPRPETLLFTNPMDYRYNWIIYYTNALYHVGDLRAAEQWTRRALEICPGDTMHRQNLAFFKGLTAALEGGKALRV
jgi:tetratricopeptide (TPR) repeat protein